MLAIIITLSEIDESNKNKFENLYYKYRNILFTYIVKIVSNSVEAEDILQESFIKIAKNIKAVGDIDSKETLSFLIVIAKNTAYDFLRRHSGYKEVSIEDIKELAEDDMMIEKLVGKLQYDKIISAIRNIRSPYNEVLYFHYVKDYSVKHTAHLLERRNETVKMQLVRGKKLLVEKLSEVLYE